jgi:signal recognition particle GTPase
MVQPGWSQKGDEQKGQGQAEAGSRNDAEITPQMTRKKLVQRFQTLRQELSQIQQKAMEEHTELQQEQKDLQSAIRKSMESNLAEENVDVERLQELQAKLQDSELAKKKKQSLEQEFKEQVNAYQRARAKTARNEKIQAKQEAFRESMLSAMNEVNPQADEIIQEMQALQHQMKFIKQSPPSPSPETKK